MGNYNIGHDYSSPLEPAVVEDAALLAVVPVMVEVALASAAPAGVALAPAVVPASAPAVALAVPVVALAPAAFTLSMMAVISMVAGQSIKQRPQPTHKGDP